MTLKLMKLIHNHQSRKHAPPPESRIVTLQIIIIFMQISNKISFFKCVTSSFLQHFSLERKIGSEGVENGFKSFIRLSVKVLLFPTLRLSSEILKCYKVSRKHNLQSLEINCCHSFRFTWSSLKLICRKNFRSASSVFF